MILRAKAYGFRFQQGSYTNKGVEIKAGNFEEVVELVDECRPGMRCKNGSALRKNVHKSVRLQFLKGKPDLRPADAAFFCNFPFCRETFPGSDGPILY